MKINQLKIHNFKIFDDVTFDFRSQNITLFCGKNGFGKTSIFDALELVFTGRISRYQTYVETCHNGRFPLKNGKPLMHDDSVKDVFVEIEIEWNGQACVLRREASYDEIKNPIKFDDCFQKLYWRKTNENQFRVAGKGFLRDFDLFVSYYGQINYQSQEEATSFLKSKEDERTKQIEILFDTTEFDVALLNLTSAKEGLEKLLRDGKKAIETADKRIKELQQQNIEQDESAGKIGYLRLFEKAEFGWDKETPVVTISDLESLVGQEGELDKLVYYLKYQSVYQQYLQNNGIKHVVSKGIVKIAARYLKYQTVKSIITQYEAYSCTYRNLYAEIKLDSIDRFVLQPSDKLEAVLNSDTISSLEKDRQQISLALKSCNQLQGAYEELVSGRNSMRQALPIIDMVECPLCGQTYESKDSLLEKIDSFGKRFEEETKKLNLSVAHSFEKFKKGLLDMVIQPLDEYFTQHGITAETYPTYTNVEEQANSKEVQFILRQTKLEDYSQLSVDEIQKLLTDELNKLVVDLSDTKCDWALMKEVSLKYGKYVDEKVTKENIEKKRLYLISFWNRLNSKLLGKVKKECGQLHILQAKYEAKLKLVNDLLGKIKEQRAAHIERVVSDIEILFYIYSGRIMQDSYYERGVFLKFNNNSTSSAQRILLTGDYHKDVDVLYNMSSGQLVSVALAFMLSLNKLYDNHKFLAIDDPVQTIDDINFWGLIETLRHEFKDHNIFLSTHEDNYASLMRYKLDKMNIPVQAMDMATLKNKK